MLLVPYTLAHLHWNLSSFPCVNPQPLYLENTHSSSLGWGSGAWPWPPLLFQTHQLKHPGHISELLQTWAEEGSWVGAHRPSQQALGANVAVPEPTGAASLGHWKCSSLEAAGGAADGLFGCVPWHMGSDVQALSPPCRIRGLHAITPALPLAMGVQSIFLSAEVALCQALGGRICYSAPPRTQQW